MGIMLFLFLNLDKIESHRVKYLLLTFGQMKPKYIFLFFVLNSTCFFALSQDVESKIKHIVYSNRLLFRSSDYIKNAKLDSESKSNFYQKIFPRYGEYFNINLVKLDSMKIGNYEMYEYSIFERCYSSGDSNANAIMKSDPELHFADGQFKPCHCCNVTGDGFSESIPGLSDCTNTKGIIAVHYPYSTNAPIVYFVSGNCVILDPFEKILYANQLLNERNLALLFQLKFWNSDTRKLGSRMSKFTQLRKNKYRIFFNDTEQCVIVKLKRDKTFQLIK